MISWSDPIRDNIRALFTSVYGGEWTTGFGNHAEKNENRAAQIRDLVRPETVRKVESIFAEYHRGVGRINTEAAGLAKQRAELQDRLSQLTHQIAGRREQILSAAMTDSSLVTELNEQLSIEQYQEEALRREIERLTAQREDVLLRETALTEASITEAKAAWQAESDLHEAAIRKLAADCYNHLSALIVSYEAVAGLKIKFKEVGDDD